MLDKEIAALEALGRLCQIAKRDTGQSRRVANFLLASVRPAIGRVPPGDRGTAETAAGARWTLAPPSKVFPVERNCKVPCGK